MAKDLSKLSDEELMQIASQGEKQKAISSMSDEDLERIANQGAKDEPSLAKDVYVKTIVDPTDTAFSPAELETPTYVTPPGTVTFVVPNLINQQRYSFVVRAQPAAQATGAERVR